jgi:hypothetical protein
MDQAWREPDRDLPDHLQDVVAIIAYEDDGELLAEVAYYGTDAQWHRTGCSLCSMPVTVRAWQPLPDVRSWAGWRAAA